MFGRAPRYEGFQYTSRLASYFLTVDHAQSCQARSETIRPRAEELQQCLERPKVSPTQAWT